IDFPIECKSTALPHTPFTFTSLSFRPHQRLRCCHTMTLRALLATLLLTLCAFTSVAAAPEGQLTWAVHVSLAPAWFDPAETAGIITPFMFLYAMHDALVKSMPGNALAPSLAESWTVSPDYL